MRESRNDPRSARGAFGHRAVLLVLAMSGLVGAASAPGRFAPTDPPNKPIGEAQGIFPGRVVWVHDPQVARWGGDPAAGGWYEDRFTDPERAARMLSQSLRLLTGGKTDREAWAKLFVHFNRTHARGDIGYKPGEKVAVKLNMNCAGRRSIPTDGFYNTPQLTLALLAQLVGQAGVREEDIILFDASRYIPDSIFLPARERFPGIRFEDCDGGEGRHKAEPDREVTIHFNDPSARAPGGMHLPRCVTAATYLINAAVMKGHDLAGVTLCAKNHFGSVYPKDASPQGVHRGWDPARLHEPVTVRTRAMGQYNPLVELMGHRDLGGKTMLYLIDAIYAAPRQSVPPEKWKSSPFNGHWTSSVFVSQDPVAIESVAVDFFAVEPSVANMVGAVDNFLHEAALASRPPSGARYDPEGDGAPLASLGVHEHWNSAEKREYSRNLGTGQGIGLMVVDMRPEASARAAVPGLALDDALRKAQEERSSSLKSVFTNFWQTEFPKYGLHAIVREAIDEIDDAEMFAFLKQRGVELNPEYEVTSANLIAYLRHKKIGTEATYAWIDLVMGKPAFGAAVLDLQTIRNERGFEFVPVYYSLLNARLTQCKHAEAWSDLFNATFERLAEADTDQKVLMLFSLLPRIPGDLNSIYPPPFERFAFLAEELDTQRDLSRPYPQALLFALFEANFCAQRFSEAAQLARHLSPPSSGLYFCFLAHSLAKDIRRAKATLIELERVAQHDEAMLSTCREVIRQLDQMIGKQDSNEPQGGDGK